MKTRHALLSMIAALMLGGCGNKGPLVLPDRPVAPVDPKAAPTQTPPPTPAATAPAPLDQISSPLPPSSPPAATDPILQGAGDDSGG